MCRQIMRPEVRFDFDDTPDAFVPARHVHQMLPKQLFCDLDRIAIVELARKLPHHYLARCDLAVRNVIE